MGKIGRNSHAYGETAMIFLGDLQKLRLIYSFCQLLQRQSIFNIRNSCQVVRIHQCHAHIDDIEDNTVSPPRNIFFRIFSSNVNIGTSKSNETVENPNFKNDKKKSALLPANSCSRIRRRERKHGLISLIDNLYSCSELFDFGTLCLHGGDSATLVEFVFFLCCIYFLKKKPY